MVITISTPATEAPEHTLDDVVARLNQLCGTEGFFIVNNKRILAPACSNTSRHNRTVIVFSLWVDQERESGKSQVCFTSFGNSIRINGYVYSTIWHDVDPNEAMRFLNTLPESACDIKIDFA